MENFVFEANLARWAHVTETKTVLEMFCYSEDTLQPSISKEMVNFSGSEP